MADTAKATIGVFALVFNRDYSKVLLVRRNYEKKSYKGKEWGNVGGRIDAGETSIEACIREAREETGLKLRPSDLRLLCIIEHPNTGMGMLHFVYATAIDERVRITLNEESYEYRWFAMGNLPESTLDSRKDIRAWRDMANAGAGIQGPIASVRRLSRQARKRR